MANTPEGGPAGPPNVPEDLENQPPRGQRRDRRGGRGRVPEPQEPQPAATTASATAAAPTPEARRTPLPPATPPAPVEPPVPRPTMDDARRMPWWRRLFGGAPQTEAERNMAQDRDMANQDIAERRLDVDEEEEEKSIDRSTEPEELRQPKNPAELVNLVEQLNIEEYRERKLREKYGEGAWGNFKAYLAGERAYSYNGRREVEFNALADAGRRFWNVITDRRVLMGVGAAAIVGLLTGGAGVAAAGGIIGAIVGRSAGELAEAAFGQDRRLRMQIAQRQYDHFLELRQKAQSIRSPENSDEDRIRYMNELVNNFYDQDKRILELESSLGKDKAKWDKIKGFLTIAGSAVGVGMALSGEWAKMGAAGAEKVKMYDFDHNGQWHSIDKLNNEYIYHIRDAQGHITGSHTLGGTPTPEMLKHFIYQNITNEGARKAAMMHFAGELGKGVAVILGAGIGHALGMPAYEKGVSETRPEDLKYAKERIQKQLPETPKKKELTPEEKKEQEKNEPKISQLWTFDDYINNLTREHRSGADLLVTNLIDNQQFPLKSGSWEVVNVDENNVTLESRTMFNPTNNESYILKIPKKELQEKGKLSTGIAKEHEKILAGKDVQKLKEQFEAGNNIIVFRTRIAGDFFTRNFNLQINPRDKYEIADFNDKENKISIRNIDTGQKINDLNLAVFIDAIKELKGAESAKEGEKEKDQFVEYNEIIKKFNLQLKERPVKSDVWYFDKKIIGIDQNGEEMKFNPGFYIIASEPNKDDLTINIIDTTNKKIFGKIKVEELLNDNYMNLDQAIEERLLEKRNSGIPIPDTKKLEREQIWEYKYEQGNSPDTKDEDYKIKNVDNKTGTIVLTRNNPAKPKKPITRSVNPFELIEKGTFFHKF